jgi:aldehyde:ferredoxin oxidoreductase
MPYGYNGKILRVNLTTNEISVESPPDVFYRMYLGGRGFIGYFLNHEVPAKCDPLGEENKIIVATSVVTGAPIAGFGRQSIGAKSPLTGFYGESEAGGFFGPELKFAGYDAIIVEGMAKKPSYIWINDGQVEIKDASAVWGTNTADCLEALQKEVDEPKAKSLLIGKAGENMVKFSGVAGDVTHYHGRTGMGAVFGSKKLKGILVRGTKKLEVADKEKLQKIAKNFIQHFKENVDNGNHTKIGTSGYYFGASDAGSLPTRNFQGGSFPEMDFTLEELHEELKIKTDGCYACPVRCKQVFEAKAPEKPYDIDPRYGGPEYECLASFGSVCGVTDKYVPSKCHELCNKYSMDVVSCGVTIGWAIECFERGLLTKEDTDGMELKWGNGEAVLELVEKIANREGFGKILAEGSWKASQIIGRGTSEFSMTTKGQEFAMAEPRAKMGLGLAYITTPVGADHLQAEHDGAFDPNLVGYSHAADDPAYFMKGVHSIGLIEPVPSLDMGPAKCRLFTYLQHHFALHNILDMCIFVTQPVRTLPMNDVVEVVAAVTGWITSMWDLLKVAERSTTLARVFNLKAGLERSDDTTLPERMFEGLDNGTLKGSKLNREDVEPITTIYYEGMGWDGEHGIPTEGTLYQLGIGWAIEDLIPLMKEKLGKEPVWWKGVQRTGEYEFGKQTLQEYLDSAN